MTVISATSSSRNSAKGILLIQSVAAIVVAAILVLFVTPYGAAISPDSVFYLDIATHIRSGEGVKSTDYTLVHAGEGRAVANTTWPPLYPTLLALTATAPDASSAALLSVLLLGATLFCVQRVLGQLLPWWLATLAALPLAVLVPMLTIHVYAWSEQLFVVLLVALLWATQRYFAADAPATQRRRMLMAIAVLLVLAFYTRYIGIVFFALLPLLYLLDRRPRALLPIFLGCGAFCATAAVGLLIYNLQVGGSITGTTRASAQSTVLEQLHDLVYAIVPFFQIPSLTGLIGLFALAAMAATFFLSSQREAPSAKRRAVLVTAGWAFGGAAYYLVSIVLLRTFVTFDEMDVRLVGVVTPYIWIGCMALIAGCQRDLKDALPAVVAVGVVTVLVITGCFTSFAVRESWLTNGTPGLRRFATAGYNNFNQPPEFNRNRLFLAPITDAGSILVIEQPHVIQYTTGLASYNLPREYSAAEVQKLFDAPARSHLLIPRSEINSLQAKLAPHGVKSLQVIPAGNTLLVDLPLTKEDMPAE